MADLEQVSVTLDGLEAIRLADLEGLYQEEAASRMGVSRATFARVLAAARRSVADALVNNKALEIDGGAVERRARSDRPCPVHGVRRRLGRGCRCEDDGAAGPGRGRGRGAGRGSGRRGGQGRGQQGRRQK